MVVLTLWDQGVAGPEVQFAGIEAVCVSGERRGMRNCIAAYYGHMRGWAYIRSSRSDGTDTSM